MLSKNQVVTLICQRFGLDAAGVCHHEGMAVFVPGLLPGEGAQVKIIKVEKRHAYGRVERLLEPSPQRAQPPCPVYARCGGCCAQHMTYEASLAFKHQLVKDALERIGGLDIPVPPVLGATHPFGYRNKGSYPVAPGTDGPAIGFYAPRSHGVVDLTQGCLIQRGASSQAVDAVRQWMVACHVPPYDEVSHAGVVRHIVTRVTQSGELMVVLVTRAQELPAVQALIAGLSAVPGVKSLVHNINPLATNVIFGEVFTTLWGLDTLEETLCGLRFRVSPRSFFQVNPEQTQVLYSLAMDYADLDGTQRVIDAYCGAGTISLLLARRAAEVIGIEIVPEAVEDARANGLRNGIANASFICGAVEEALPKLVAQGERPHVVVLDPPRKGCEEAVLAAIAKAGPQRVVYVSCNPATLARDAKRLTELGYEAHGVQPVDLFCWTGAVECVMGFQRLEG